ncbi:hypothetical protein J0895_15145 [Phormidium pseudopriestleyi FRX01]|uniref:Uncharacterized protein n=1 Tax=Phormidium pseudopriestleyi FRX01 TaxID=1759528 RepID=A0ABS3FUG0_9CYAN|nr:hypothetical protein [Phormidium pseudopriestleyi]MBO0350408.1 hypothetical protein [Phormidium pseudopriestleyi FRX01]
MFPKQKFTITTYLSPDDVQKKLIEVVEPPPTRIQFQWKRSDKLYRGQIGEHSFKIARIIYYRNSFLPQIEGRINAHGRGSQIEIEMKLHRFVLIFICVWLSMVGQFVLMALMVLFQEEFEPAFLVPVGMFIFGLALPWIGFIPEAKGSKKFLLELFQGIEENPL